MKKFCFEIISNYANLNYGFAFTHPKIQLCGSESEERAPKKGMSMVKVDERHVHTVYEKIMAGTD